MAKSVLAADIEKALAIGYKSEAQQKSQQARLDKINAAFERGGEPEAYYADMMFVVGHTD